VRYREAVEHPTYLTLPYLTQLRNAIYGLFQLTAGWMVAIAIREK
jgi:hypothetical protein